MALEQEHPRTEMPPSVNAGTREEAVALARLVAEGLLPREIGITCRGRADGAGSQAFGVITAMAMARFVGCRYLHTPFAMMSHAEDTREDWARRWERFLNFGEGETPVPEDAEVVPLSEVVAAPAAYAGRPVVVFATYFRLPLNADVPICESLRTTLRARYARSPKNRVMSHRDPGDGWTVAIHVRRGDVSATRNSSRYTPNETVLRQITRLKRALAPFGRPLTLNLYSEGVPDDFRAFADAGCNLHIGESPFEAFHNLATADILMRASGNFSYVSGLLSEGIVLSARRQPPHLAGWIPRSRSGDMSIKRTRRALLGRIGWRERCAYRIRRLAGM